jgi:hypothetical protein
MDEQYSFEPDNVEYLDIDDFLALGKRTSIRCFLYRLLFLDYRG